MSNPMPATQATSATHVAVWIDHKEAHIFHIRADEGRGAQVTAQPHNLHRRHPGSGAKAHPSDDKHFFHEVALALAGSKEILVVGPSTAKLELLRHLHAEHAAVEKCFVGVEKVDHPTDRQLIAFARVYFVRVDQMR